MEIINVVDKVSDILNMSVHHFEHKKFEKDYLNCDSDASPIIVAYSDEFSKWCFAIMDDLSVVTPTMNMLKLVAKIGELIPNEVQDKFEEETLMLSNLKFAEEFLKNSDLGDSFKNFTKETYTLKN